MERLGLFPAVWREEERQPRVHAYYFKQWERYDMAYHRHDSTEIMYVISGVCEVWLQAGDARGPSGFELKKGEFILLNANAPHRLVVRDTCRMLNVEFGPAAHESAAPSVKRLAEEDGPLDALLSLSRPYVVLRDPEEVYHTLKSLVLELDSFGMDSGALGRLLLCQLLVRVARLRQEASDEPAGQAALYVKMSATYLYENYDRTSGSRTRRPPSICIPVICSVCSRRRPAGR
jgi:mannose-6-phosphate isomerase-like protein (cupin superfamily)